MSPVDMLALLLVVCAVIGAAVLIVVAFLAVVFAYRGLAWLGRLVRRPALEVSK